MTIVEEMERLKRELGYREARAKEVPEGWFVVLSNGNTVSTADLRYGHPDWVPEKERRSQVTYFIDREYLEGR